MTQTNGHTKNCAQCGESFSSRRSDARFCGQRCAKRSLKGVPHQRACATCGCNISHRMGNAQYCASCTEDRPKAHEESRKKRAARPALCPQCESEYTAHAPEQKYCSMRCSLKATRAAQLSKVLTKTCLACGDQFTTRDARVVGCSTACKHWARKYPGRTRALLSQCETCGNLFEGSRANMRFCSRRCIAYAGKHIRRARERGNDAEPVSRSAILERDRWKCQLCRKPIPKTLKAPHPRSPSLDHIIPLSQGGAHRPANVQAAHLGCNVSKGNRGGGEQLLLIG